MPSKPRPNRITISDVARDAGVSITTVSLVLNRVASATISDVTRERVEASALKLNYRPNAAAKQLRTRQSNTIGFITDAVASNPNAGDVIRGAQDVAWKHGKVLMIVNTTANPVLAERAAQQMMERQVEGLIYAADHHQPVELPSVFHEVPCVLVDCFTEDPVFPSVVPDEVGGGLVATMALLEAGHRRVGFINLNDGLPASNGRLVGYQRALAQYRIPFDPDLILPGGDDIGLPYNQTRRLMALPEPPTGIFCATDRMAMEAYAALADLGLRVPDHVSVVGFDNQEIVAARLRPGLTTVQLPHYEMGAWASERLLAMVGGDPGEAQQISLPCPLVVRSSIGPPAGRAGGSDGLAIAEDGRRPQSVPAARPWSIPEG